MLVGVNTLGFTFVRITALIASCSQLWIGTGNGVVLRAPLSESQHLTFALCTFMLLLYVHVQNDLVSQLFPKHVVVLEHLFCGSWLPAVLFQVLIASCDSVWLVLVSNWHTHACRVCFSIHISRLNC